MSVKITLTIEDHILERWDAEAASLDLRRGDYIKFMVREGSEFFKLRRNRDRMT